MYAVLTVGQQRHNPFHVDDNKKGGRSYAIKTRGKHFPLSIYMKVEIFPKFSLSRRALPLTNTY